MTAFWTFLGIGGAIAFLILASNSSIREKLIMKLKGKHQSLLKVLLIASIIATGIHFTDNYRFIEQYPQPGWITAPSIYQSWLFLTAVGIAGYWLYKFDKFWLAYGCLILYSFTGLASPGHYFYGSLSQFSLKMHLLIWADGLTGLAVLGFTLWSALFFREWQRELRSSE